MMEGFPETLAPLETIELPPARVEGDISVEEALKSRRSVRSYADAPLTMAEVGQLLWAAYGISYPIEDGPAFLRGGLRTAPSAGALYPLEVYLVARDVTGLDPGVYWYDSEDHTLGLLVREDRWADLSAACHHQPHFETAAAALVWSAVFERNTRKYGQRGRERYVCMDLGHSGENVYLQAYALGVGTCAIGAFTDLRLKETVGMSRAEEPLYVMPLGKTE
jgi:SagB-type dehydrogenase family enzyme